MNNRVIDADDEFARAEASRCLANEPTRVGACSDLIKGRKGQHLKLQLRSLGFSACLVMVQAATLRWELELPTHPTILRYTLLRAP